MLYMYCGNEALSNDIKVNDLVNTFMYAKISILSYVATKCVVFLARLHLSAEELLLYPRRRRPCPRRRPRRRPQNVRANVNVLEF